MRDTFIANYKEKMYERSLFAKLFRKLAKLELGQCLKKNKNCQLRNQGARGVKVSPLFAKSLRKFRPNMHTSKRVFT